MICLYSVWNRKVEVGNGKWGNMREELYEASSGMGMTLNCGRD